MAEVHEARASRRSWLTNGMNCVAGWDRKHECFYVEMTRKREDRTEERHFDYLDGINHVEPWFSARGATKLPYELIGGLFDDRRDSRTTVRHYGSIDEAAETDVKYGLLKGLLTQILAGSTAIKSFERLFSMVEAHHANPEPVKRLLLQTLEDGLTLHAADEIGKTANTARDAATRRHLHQARVGDV